VCPPDDPAADYRLRIFTPRAELPFAGHPTIGSAHAVLRRGYASKRSGRLVQECGKGLVELRVEGERIFLALPVPTFHAPDAGQRARAAAALGVAPEEIGAAAIVDVGPVWFTLQLPDAARVAALTPDMAAVAAVTRDPVTGLNVFGFHREGGPGGESGAGPADVEVRSFAPAHGVPEDPVCGSGNGCVAALIQRERLLSRQGYVASQGRCLGRDGRVEVRYDGDGRIWLGGHAVTCVEGTLTV
jgi:PhzF family phenazine biosynthesis protein